MDPNAALARIRELVAQLRDPEQIDCAEHAQMVGDELVEHVQDLDGWLTGGGFLPADWQPKAKVVGLRGWRPEARFVVTDQQAGIVTLRLIDRDTGSLSPFPQQAVADNVIWQP